MRTTTTCADAGCERHATIGRYCRAHDPNPPRPEGLACFACVTEREVVEAHSQITQNELTAVLKRPARDRSGRWHAPFIGYLDGRFVGVGTTEAEALHAIHEKRKEKSSVSLAGRKM